MLISVPRHLEHTSTKFKKTFHVLCYPNNEDAVRVKQV